MDKDAKIADLEAELEALKKDRADLVNLFGHMMAQPKVSPQLRIEIAESKVKWGLRLTA